MPSKVGNVAILCFAAVTLLFYGPAAPRVARAVHLAHPARAQDAGNLERSEVFPWNKVRATGFLRQPGRVIPRWLVDRPG